MRKRQVHPLTGAVHNATCPTASESSSRVHSSVCVCVFVGSLTDRNQGLYVWMHLTGNSSKTSRKSMPHRGNEFKEQMCMSVCLTFLFFLFFLFLSLGSGHHPGCVVKENRGEPPFHFPVAVAAHTRSLHPDWRPQINKYCRHHVHESSPVICSISRELSSTSLVAFSWCTSWTLAAAVFTLTVPVM